MLPRLHGLRFCLQTLRNIQKAIQFHGIFSGAELEADTVFLHSMSD